MTGDRWRARRPRGQRRARTAAAEGDAEGYGGTVVEMMPERFEKMVKADAVDAFCDRIGFTPEQTAAMSPHYI